jgi:hypothetical protein
MSLMKTRHACVPLGREELAEHGPGDEVVAGCGAGHRIHFAGDILVLDRRAFLEAEVLVDGHRPEWRRVSHGARYARRRTSRKRTIAEGVRLFPIRG